MSQGVLNHESSEVFARDVHSRNEYPDDDQALQDVLSDASGSFHGRNDSFQQPERSDGTDSNSEYRRNHGGDVQYKSQMGGDDRDGSEKRGDIDRNGQYKDDFGRDLLDRDDKSDPAFKRAKTESRVINLSGKRRYSEERETSSSQKQDSSSTSRCMFIGNIALNTNEITLAKFCGRFGSVRHVKIVKDRESGLSRGYAFVSYFSGNDCMAACRELHEAYLDGKKLRVEPAKGYKFEGIEIDGYFPNGGGPDMSNYQFSDSRRRSPDNYNSKDDSRTSGGRGTLRTSARKYEDSDDAGYSSSNSQFLTQPQRNHIRVVERDPSYERPRQTKGSFDSDVRKKYDSKRFEDGSKPQSSGSYVKRGESREPPPRKVYHSDQFHENRSPKESSGGGFNNNNNNSSGYNSGYRGAGSANRSTFSAPKSPQYQARNSKDYSGSKHFTNSFSSRGNSRYSENYESGSKKPPFQHSSGSVLPDPRSIFIGGLSNNVSPERIMQLFGRCGSIESVRIKPDKGFGFISFTSVQAANDAIKFMDKMELDGRILKVAPNEPPASKTRSFATSHPSDSRSNIGGNYSTERPFKRKMERRF